jgi:hypothetical protein
MQHTEETFKIAPNNKERLFSINENLFAIIDYISPGIAGIYFTNAENTNVPIPNNIKVYTYDFSKHNPDKRRFLCEAIKNVYIVSFTDRYDIELDGKCVVKLTDYRAFTINRF